MKSKKLTIFVLILLLLGFAYRTSHSQVESSLPDSLQSLNFWSNSGKFVGQRSAVCPPLASLEVFPETGIVGVREVYRIKMTLPEGGIPRSGGVAFNFPPNFDLGHIAEIDYSDDYSESDLTIRKIFVFRGTCVILFKSGQSPPAGTVITFTMHSVGNPTVAGNYQISGLIFSPHLKVVSGPTLSQPFPILPGPPVTLEITPSDPITLRAGNSQLFLASARDRFQNEISNPEVLWAFAPGSDSLGVLSGGNLFATTVGTGKVVAIYNALSATSGPITVLPGMIDHFEISSYPLLVAPGEPFPSGVRAEAYDRFGNLKNDYIESAYFMSSDPNAELSYDISNPYQFVIADSGRHLFAGDNFKLFTPGVQTISLTDGLHSGRSGIITVGGATSPIVSFKIAAEPAGEIRAGTPLAIKIYDAVDRDGKPAGGLVKISLEGDGISPGGFTPILNDAVVSGGAGSANQYLYLTGEAKIRAAADTVIREIAVTVMPGDLGNFKLSIQPTQFTGHSLLGPATLTIYDKFGNLKTDFDAAVTPVTIAVDRGELNRTALAASDDFVAGVADLSTKDIRFDGDAGQVIMIFAVANLDASALLRYDGLDFRINEPIPDTIMIGQRYMLRAEVINNGFTSPLSPVTLSDYFTSCPVVCLTQMDIREIEPGETYRLLLGLNTDHLTPHPLDTVHVTVASKYLFGGDTVTVMRTRSFPVAVVEPINLTYVPGSLTFDTVLSPSFLPNASFQLTIDRDIDTSSLNINAYLNIDCGGNDFGVYVNSVTASLNGRIITLALTGLHIPDLKQSGCFEGLKKLTAGITLYYMDQLLYRSDLISLDSVFVVYPAELSYRSGTLSPSIAPAGGSVPFEFGLDFSGLTTIMLDSSNSWLELAFDGGSLTGFLTPAGLTLKPGENKLTTKTMDIPSSLLNKILTPHLYLNGTELYMTRSDTISFGSDKITVSGLPQIKIVSTDLVTINPPYLDYGQKFSIKLRVQNLSGQVISNVAAVITSENGHDTLSSGTISAIAPYNYQDILLPMTADTVSQPIVIFKSLISSLGALILPPDDNFTAATIQSPAEITLLANITGAYGTIHYLDYAQPFTITVQMTNSGEADARPGQVMLLTGTYDFGIPDSSTMALAVGNTGQWSLVSPSITALVNLVVKMVEIPIDKNTGLPARVKTGQVAIPVLIEPSAAELLVSGTVSPAPLIVEGTSRELLSLNLKNNTENRLNVISLKTIDIRFYDRDKNPISPATVIDADSSGFFAGDSKLTSSFLTDNILRLSFVDFTIQPKDERTISFHAHFRDVITQAGFSLEIANSDVRAIFASGPRMNQPVPIKGRIDSNFRVGGNFILTPQSTEKSLMVRNNPFNPNLEQAEIAYNLETDAGVDLNIYTLAGEKVYGTTYPAGSSGGRQGPNYVNWDGRNSDGKVVMNGVYVMIIRNTSSGQSFKLKLAVLK
ncbi:exported hypothetical protein [Candidatus Zixiibacteriota bacterium]|nr:exported hypothetical protein [candidate division Zixibacteria bacterium]